MERQPLRLASKLGSNPKAPTREGGQGSSQNAKGERILHGNPRRQPPLKSTIRRGDAIQGRRGAFFGPIVFTVGRDSSPRFFGLYL